MVAHFNARTTLESGEKDNVLSAAGFNESLDSTTAGSLNGHTIPSTGQQFVQPL